MEEPGQGTSPSVYVRGIKCGCSADVAWPRELHGKQRERTVRRTCD
jgi:hypothetical protein